MSKKVLTDRGIKALKPKAKPYIEFDAVVPAMGVRVMPSGHKSFVLVTRYPGSRNPVPRSLGAYGEITLEEARAKARRWLELLVKGIDPAHEEERHRLAEQRKRTNTFGAVAEDFIRDKLPGERKGKEVERDIRREFIPVWGTRPVTEVSPQDVRDVVRGVRDRGAPYQAHNLFGTASRLFGWAIDQHVYGLEMSPCDRLKPKAIIGAKRARSRIHSEDELFAYWRATKRIPYPCGPACRMLVLLGQRHREVTEARWSEFHPQLVALLRQHAENGEPINWQSVKSEWKLWSVDEERFKSDATHMVPLSDDVCALLATLPRFFNGDYLFSTTLGEKPIVISNKVKRQIDARMLRTLKALARKRGDDPARVELKPWIIHDLRRVLRSHLSGLKVQDHIAEMVIGHGRKGLQRVYDQWRYTGEMHEALTAWAFRLRGIVGPAATSNVVQLRTPS